MENQESGNKIVALGSELNDGLGAAKWSDELVCEWRSWTVIAPVALLLKMPEGQCCDMEGTVQLGQVLMPDVETIYTQVGEGMDTTYVKCADGTWRSMDA